MIIKNIESKIKLALIVSILSIVSGLSLAFLGVYQGIRIAENASEQIYVLNIDGVPSLAQRSDSETSFELEAKSTIKTFHRLFFTLPPDDKYIERTISEALYLIDESGVKQRNALLDKGFYNDILSHSANFTIVCDSITLDQASMTFRYYGKQRIEKKYSLTTRELITTGGLRKIARTENNPFGYLIIDYRTISNRDLAEERKQSL